MKDPRYPDSTDQPAGDNPASPDLSSASPPAGTDPTPPPGEPPGTAPPLTSGETPSGGEPSVTEPAPVATPPVRDVPAQRSPLAGIAIILSLLTLAGVAWLWLSDQREQQQWAQQQSGLVASVEQQTQSLSELRVILEREQASGRELQQSMERQATQLQSDLQRELLKTEERQRQEARLLNERLDDHQRRLVTLSASNREHWLLAEAVYLLRLANQRVLIEGTPENAVTLIHSADDLVRQAAQDSGSAELQALRRSLAADINALNTVESVDREGLYARLQTLEEGLQALPASSAARFEATAAGQTAPAAPADLSWTQKAWAEIKSMVGVVDQYFRIQDAQTPSEPLADQAALRLVRLHAGLLLEQAEIALLKADARVYRESLAKAAAALGGHFQPSTELTEFRKSLDELQQVEIAPELPDISGSLQKLMGYIQDLERRGGAAGVAP